MKNDRKNVVDEHLGFLEGMKEVEAGPFFYSRLKARMESDRAAPFLWRFPLRPAWVIGGLVLLLAMNGFMLSNEYKGRKSTASQGTSLQRFAETYDQTINSTY